LQDIPRYFQSLQNAAHTLESGSSVPLGISENISKIVSPEAVESALRSTIENLKNIGLFIIKICIALILSFVFIHDRKKIGKFLTSMKRGSFGFIYDEYEIIFEKISR
jgi:predicted PurR-regulated permease PerM